MLADEYSEFPTPPDLDQTLVNQCHELPLSSQPNSSFQKMNNHTDCSTTYPLDQPDEEVSHRNDWDYEVPCDHIVCSPLFACVTSFP